MNEECSSRTKKTTETNEESIENRKRKKDTTKGKKITQSITFDKCNSYMEFWCQILVYNIGQEC